MQQPKNTQQELAELLSNPATSGPALNVSQKFSQAAKPGATSSQLPGSQLLDKHYSAYGGTASQVIPP